MGYPDCDDINDRDHAVLSPGDRLGLHYLYTLPKSGSIHFDNDASDDILWVDPGGTSLELWRGGADLNQNIMITKEVFSPVSLPDRVSRRVKPIPLRLGDGSLVSVLLHSPGTADAEPGGEMWNQEEIVLQPTPGQLAPFERIPFTMGMSIAEMPERYAVPLVANLLGPSADEVWWLLPGPDGVRGDPIWEVDLDAQSVETNSAYDESFSADNYFRPLVGSWINGGASAVDSQILWWSDRTLPAKFRMLMANGQMNGPDGDMKEVGLCAAGMIQGKLQYTPFVGNFDDDDEWEIFWIAGKGSSHIMWWNVEEVLMMENCDQASQLPLATAPQLKPFVGDFNGDGVNDIFWYEGGADTEFDEQIWYFRNNASHGFDARSILNIDEFGDRTPYVADLNGDGCEDILWFSPHESLSPLWQGRCGAAPSLASLFSVRPALAHPECMYPLGYARNRSRR